MPPLPRVSGKQVIRALKRVGSEEFDQSGSHVYPHRWTGERWSERVTVPVHGNKTLKLPGCTIEIFVYKKSQFLCMATRH